MESKNSSMMVGVLVALLVLGAGAFFLINRDSDDDTGDTDSNAQTTVQERTDEFPLDISFSNLAPLSQGAYEGWVVRDDVKHSFGRFNATAAGAIDGTFVLSDITPQNGDTVAISIEPENDTDPEPSATIILAGEIMNGSADLAFPLDVSEFAGQYILATPSSSTLEDETSGIWFTITGADTGLDIPVAPEGWIYEGWAVVDGVPITTGQFTDPNLEDNFSGYSGPGNFPDKPGEDFIQGLPNGLSGPLELAGGGSMVVVSIEPYQNGEDPTGPAPAQVKPLSHAIAEGAGDHTPFDLDLSTDTIPSGVASL